MKKKTNILKVFSFHGEPYMNNKEYMFKESPRHLVLMSPDTYIEKCAEILGITYEQLIGTRLRDRKSFEYIENAANKGLLTIPIIDYIHKKQDGIHRAMWAKEKGMTSIPVFMFK